MKLLLLSSILVLLAGCGGAATTYPQIGGPNNSVAGITSQSLTATMTSTGAGTPGTWTVTKAGKIVIPSPSNFMILQDTTEAWQINLLVNSGVQSCNFAHLAGGTEISAGNGCSVTTSYISVNVGDIITLSIATGVTQTASVGVNLTETN
jgi:hypothetical protein